MKTFKSLFLIFFMSCFTFSMVYAQSPKMTDEGTYFQSAYYLDCVDETVAGELNFESVMVNSKYQEKIWGTLIGDKGNEYTISQIFNDNWHPSKNYTRTVSLKFRLDGKLVFMLHTKYHVTVANGEIVVDHYIANGECK